MDLSTEDCQVSDSAAAAMQRGLDAINQDSASIIVSGNFARTIERLEPTTRPFGTDRGTGVVAAKTLRSEREPIIVINGDVVLECEIDEIERLLAHEGGHVTIHKDGQSVEMEPLLDRYSPGVGTLNATAAIVIEEFRVERRLAELGYPPAEQTLPKMIDDQLFDLACEVFEALFDPASDADVWGFARAVLTPVHHMTITLGYLAAPIIAGANNFTPNELSVFGRNNWNEIVRGSWAKRLELYRQIPPSGTHYDGALASAHLRQAASIERQLLHDLGFTIGGGRSPGDEWSFQRTGTETMFNARLARLRAEYARRV